MNINITSLYNEYYPKLLYYAFKFLPYDKQRAEEIVDDVFLKVGSGRFKNIFALNDWLYTSVKNGCIDHFRNLKRKHTVYCEIDADDYEYEDAGDSYKIMAETVSRIMNEIEKLSPQQKIIIQKRFFEKKNVLETATELGLAVPTVKNVTLNAVKTLKMNLGLIKDTRKESFTDKVKELFSKGHAAADIARVTGIEKKKVSNCISYIKHPARSH